MHKSTLIAPALPSFTVLFVLALTACSDSNNETSDPVNINTNSQSTDEQTTGVQTNNSGGVDSETENNSTGDGSQNTDENTSVETGSAGGTPIQTDGGTVPARLKTMSLDFDRDGTINEVWTYSYDSDGRIISRDVSDIDDPTYNYTIAFNYEGNNLVSKVSSSGEQDTHVYNSAGQVISSQRYWDGLHEYGYDSSGRLTSYTGSDFIGSCDDDSQPVSLDEEPTASFSFMYQGDQLSTITDNDGLYTMEFVYNGQGRIRSLTESCRDGIEFSTVLSYNEDSRLTKIEDFEIDTEFDFVIDSSTTTFNYNEQGLVESSIETDSFATTTTTITHTPEGYPLTQDLVNSDQTSTFFILRDYSIMFEYEDASCQIAFTANPTLIPFLDVFLQGRDYNSPLDCIYQLDQGDF